MQEMVTGMVNLALVNSSTPLQALQDAFCLIKLGGVLSVVDCNDVKDALSGKLMGELMFYKKMDGEVLMKRFLEKLQSQCDVKKTITDFWVDPKTHMYTAIAFSPLAKPSTTLNYWVGSSIKAAPGDWSVLRVHLLKVICSADQKLYDYLIHFLAHMLQRPEEKSGVMLILLGKQGTGKGIFFQIIQKIWSRTSLLVSDINQVVGQFNAALERHFVVIMDEAMFSGDRKSQDRMKSLITENTCHIEQKYQPSRTIESFHRFFASSNHEHFSHIEGDDRRSLFIRVSDICQGDHDYFSQVGVALSDDRVIAGMVHYLMQIDLTGFNVRVRPITQENWQQKLLSLQGFDRYWFEVLMTETFEQNLYSSTSWRDGEFIGTHAILLGFQTFNKRSQRFTPTVSKEIADAVSRLCPSAQKDRQKIGAEQKRGYILPTLQTARSEFELAFKCKVEWDQA